MALVFAIMHLYKRFCCCCCCCCCCIVSVHSFFIFSFNLVSIMCLVCSFNRGNIKGTNSSKFWSDVCIYYLSFHVCEVIGFVDWLNKGFIYIRKVLKYNAFAYVLSLTVQGWQCGWQDTKIQLLHNFFFCLFFCSCCCLQGHQGVCLHRFRFGDVLKFLLLGDGDCVCRPWSQSALFNLVCVGLDQNQLCLFLCVLDLITVGSV